MDRPYHFFREPGEYTVKKLSENSSSIVENVFYINGPWNFYNNFYNAHCNFPMKFLFLINIFVIFRQKIRNFSIWYFYFYFATKYINVQWCKEILSFSALNWLFIFSVGSRMDDTGPFRPAPLGPPELSRIIATPKSPHVYFVNSNTPMIQPVYIEQLKSSPAGTSLSHRVFVRRCCCEISFSRIFLRATVDREEN